ncbi:MAG TPA: DUF5320 domain-containing protein [Spirochaetia bacterium]|nr:DUF5320 domain-containing protein [Spirochaetia bacterium]
MNNDQIKTVLRTLRRTTEDFSVILSGKKSRKVHGLYKPDTREIIIHNRNFTNDNELMYTAIHEYAHHIQFTTSPTPVSARTHTTAFWNLFHTLLFDAEEKGIYRNPFEEIEELRELTGRIREKFLSASGSLMKELGKLLLQAHRICEEHGTNFSDYLDRVLSLPRTSAQLIMKAHTLDIDPRVGFENMRSLAAIRDNGERGRAQAELLGGASPDMVKAKYAERPPPRDRRQALQQERERLERMIERLRKRLKEVEKRLEASGEE